MKKVYPIKPVPKPRMTQSDKWKKRPCVLRYRAFCDECRLLKVRLPEEAANVTFMLPTPKKELWGKPHKTKPDLSNLLKALEDAVHRDDSGIYFYSGLSKFWGKEGKIIIEYGRKPKKYG